MFEVGDRIGPCAAGVLSSRDCQADGHAGARTGVTQCVQPAERIHDIVPTAAIERVVIGRTGQPVVKGRTDNPLDADKCIRADIAA